MNKKTPQNKPTKGTFGHMQEVEDFLPAPEELTLKENPKTKVTISLDKYSVDFF